MKNKYFIPILTMLITGFINPASSQVVKSESFDGIQFPPFGWTTGKISGSDPNNKIERAVFNVPAGTPAPQSGVGMIRYRCGSMFNQGEKTFIASPPYDLTNNPGTATVSFWMYKDVANPTMKDSVTLYMNNSPTAGAGRVKVMGPISRDTVGFNGWKKYTAVIPPGFN